MSGIALNGIRTSCQFINFARVEFLQPYYPSEEEKNDAVKFANNVRKLVANALKAEMTPHTFDDLLLAEFADKLAKQHQTAGVNMIEMAPFVIDDCYRTLQMKAKTVIKLGKIYMKYCDENGRITLDTFCKVFHIKDQVLAQMLFALIMGERDNNTEMVEIKVDKKKELEQTQENQELKDDRTEEEEEELLNDDFNKNGNNKMGEKFIMFDDFLVGVAICYQEEHIDDALTLFYSMMDRESNGYIVAKDCINVVAFVERDAPKEFDHDIKQFCLTIFDIEETENVTTQLSFDGFCERVKFHKQTYVVQAFLQFIIFTFLGVKLDENMVVVSDE